MQQRGDGRLRRLQVEAVPSAEGREARRPERQRPGRRGATCATSRVVVLTWLVLTWLDGFYEAALRLEELQVAGTGRDGRLRSRASSRRVGVGERELD